MLTEEFKITGVVELFPQKGGWYYIRVPQEYTEISKSFANWGMVPIFAKVGATEWKTSLLPMGDTSHFIALKADVRKKEQISLGDTVEVYFRFNV